MIADAGFEVEGAGTTTLPEHRADAGRAAAGGGLRLARRPAAVRAPRLPGDAAEPAVAARASPPRPARRARTDLVAVRRRGAGTDLPPNA